MVAHLSAVETRPESGLNWCFLDAGALDYRVDSVQRIPLGGSQSALCYLAPALAAQGQRVSLVSRTSQPGRVLGVDCFSLDALPADFWGQGFDLLVSLNESRPLWELPGIAAYQGLRLFWNQHSPWTPGVDRLAAALSGPGGIDGVVFVSEWQRQAYQAMFALPPERCQMLRNAAPPWYPPLDEGLEAFLARRPPPLTLAYTSTPGRGLGVLLAIFPALRALMPTLRLEVYSSLEVYQGEETPLYLSYYEECRRLEGVSYFGSIPQPELAQRLARVQVLAYPNTFPETSCVALIEALAAGCQIVTSDLAVLPETAGGYAFLAPFSQDPQAFTFAYFETLRAALERWRDPAALVPQLQAQARWARDFYSWELRAREWVEMGKKAEGKTKN